MSSNEKYNIVILNHHASSPDVGGGGRHYETGKLLSENGHRVTIIASSYTQGKREYRFSNDIVIKKMNDNFNFVWLKTKPAYKNIFTRFINYTDYMRKAGKFEIFNGEPNVIIASSVHPLAWVAGYKLSQKYNAKFIVEVRDLWPLSMYEDFEGLTRKVVFNFFEALEKKYYNLARSIITTAPYAYEYIEEKYGISSGKVVHIPHGIDIDKFDKNTEQSDEVLDSELNDVLDNHFCVTYAGSLSKSEGLDTLVKAARYLRNHKDIKIVIIGNGKEKENLMEVIDKENLTNVIMFGRIERDSVPLLLKKSDVLFCGLMERKAFEYGISKNKFYDYMAAKKPIIFASSVRGSLIDKAEAGLTIRPNDPKKLSDSILYLYENIDTLGREHGKNGRMYVEKYHTTEKVARDFMKVISSN